MILILATFVFGLGSSNSIAIRIELAVIRYYYDIILLLWIWSAFNWSTSDTYHFGARANATDRPNRLSIYIKSIAAKVLQHSQPDMFTLSREKIGGFSAANWIFASFGTEILQLAATQAVHDCDVNYAFVGPENFSNRYPLSPRVKLPAVHTFGFVLFEVSIWSSTL